jgi:predicted DNA-binding antitoxin AbrB/MazE fold protein
MRLVARYSDGVLQPYETLDLPEGTEVEILLRLRK